MVITRGSDLSDPKRFEKALMAASPDQTNYHCVIMFLPRKAYTGGERYLMEVFTYLQSQGVPVEPIYVEHSTEGRHGVYLVMDCLLTNLCFFLQARRLGKLSNVVFFEDFHFHPRLWLFNLLVRLTSGPLRAVVLMQSALFYHSALKNRWARWLDDWVIRVFLCKASLILTNSEFTRQEILSLGINLNQVKAIYCGYEQVLMAESKEVPATGESKDPKRILFVGQCVEVKGIEFLVRAIPMLSDRRAILDLVGNTAAEPGYFTRLRQVVKELNLQDRVIFHGYISDKAALAQFYQHADVFVLPSLVEGFGIVLLDAMSFSLPIVATRVGAIPELVEDGVNGILVPPADPEALAIAIDKMLASLDLRRRYRENGYAFITSKRNLYSWEAVGERAFQAMQPLLKEIDR